METGRAHYGRGAGYKGTDPGGHSFLAGNERASLLKWLVAMDRSVWDDEIKKDFSKSGAGAGLLDRVKKDFTSGRRTG